jgi:predicted ATPase
VQRLVERELLYQRGLGPAATYSFTHALLRDAAYQSLLRRTRQELHHRSAQVLETQFPETKATQPELLAQHYTEAGQTAPALAYWQQAGQQALDRSASAEAVSHFTHALDLLGTRPATPERDRHELELLLDLRRALVAARGYSAPDVGHTLTRARDLCQRFEDAPRLFLVLRSLGAFHGQRGDLQTSQAFSDQARTLAQHLQDPVRLLQALVQRGNVQHWRGELLGARADFEQCLRLYESDQHYAHLASFGQDVGVSSVPIWPWSCGSWAIRTRPGRGAVRR